MPQRLHYKDFIPVGNKQRQYVSKSTGEVISQRAFSSGAHAQAGTKPTPSGKAGSGGKLDYSAKLSAYHAKEARNSRVLGIPERSKGEIMKDPLFQQYYKDYKAFRRDKDKSAKGRFAKVLVDLGLRDASWEWEVGETPDNI